MYFLNVIHSYFFWNSSYLIFLFSFLYSQLYKLLFFRIIFITFITVNYSIIYFYLIKLVSNITVGKQASIIYITSALHCIYSSNDIQRQNLRMLNLDYMVNALRHLVQFSCFHFYWIIKDEYDDDKMYRFFRYLYH